MRSSSSTMCTSFLLSLVLCFGLGRIDRLPAVLYVFFCPLSSNRSSVQVANHTSPIDCLVLSCEQTCYAMIGQRHGGILGAVQRALERSSHHIWFERSEARDRDFVRRTLQAHVNDPTKLPVLIFPEGTCIVSASNSSCVRTSLSEQY